VELKLSLGEGISELCPCGEGKRQLMGGATRSSGLRRTLKRLSAGKLVSLSRSFATGIDWMVLNYGTWSELTLLAIVRDAYVRLSSLCTRDSNTQQIIYAECNVMQGALNRFVAVLTTHFDADATSSSRERNARPTMTQRRRKASWGLQQVCEC
jgi:hypothetical protein